MAPRTIARVALVLVLGHATRAGAVTQTFSPTKDADMRSDDGGDCDNARGSVGALGVGVNCAKPPCFTFRTVVHFDLAMIPHGATLTAATLQLFISGLITSGTLATLSLLRARQPFWNENTLIWARYDCPAQSWCTAGGDVDDQLNVVPWSLGTTGIKTITHANLRALAEDAVQRRGGQLHLLFKRTVESLDPWVMVQFSSREDTDPALRPQLTLTWTAPAPTPGPTPAWVTFRDETATRLPAALSTDSAEKDIAVGDLDDDGHQDIIIVRKFPFSKYGPRDSVLLMNEPDLVSGNRILVDRTATKLGDTAGPRMPGNSRDVFVGDLNGDKAQDLVVANTCDEMPTFYQNKGGRCANWSGLTRQDGWLPPPSPATGSFSVAAKRFCAVAGEDIDKDGDIDLYFSSYRKPCVPGDGGVGDPNPTVASDKDVLLMNRIKGADATGRFIDESQAPANRLGQFANVNFGTAVEIHDLRKSTTSNTVDIIKISTKGFVTPWTSANPPPLNEGGVFILRNGGTGIFSWNAQADTLHVGNPYMFTAGDLNNDGWLDFYVVDDDLDHVFLATGPSTYQNLTITAAASPRTQDLGGNVKMADVDGDGHPDVAVADVDVDIPGCPSGRRFTLLKNDGLGNLSDPYGVDQPFHVSTHDFAFLDLNGDGCLDLFMGVCTGYKVFINTTPPKCQGG